MNVVVATLAVVASWLCLTALLAGCGYLVRRALPGERAAGLAPADLWLGLAALVVFLQVWSLVLRIGWFAWPVPIAAGLAGVVLGWRGSRPARRSTGPLALGGVAVLWLANRALGPAGDYDLGLYHLNIVGYALHYEAIPGLGNLHVRLGAGDSHLLFVAFLDHGPWAGAGSHLANGLLVSMLLLELGSRFTLRRGERWSPSFTERMAVLLVPATIVVVCIEPSNRLSSPNLDLATYVLVVVGMLYLAEYVEDGLHAAPAVTSAAAFALAATTRPIYWLPTLLALAVLALAARRTGGRGATRLAAVLPGALLAGWAGRQAILTGYPFFPVTLGGLPVDWRVPAAAVRAHERVVSAWARLPGGDPDSVLGSWSWATGWWLSKRARDLDDLAPLALLAAAAPSLVALRAPDPERRDRAAPLLAVLGVAVPTLVLWFFVAPDPRFAFAPIWIAPIALLAWALPTLRPRPSWTALGVTALVAGGLIALGVAELVWLLPVVLAGSCLLALVGRFDAGRLAHLTVLAVIVAVLGLVADRGGFHPVTESQGGPFGTAPEPTAALIPFYTRSALRLWQPTVPNARRTRFTDQCWEALLCAPSPSAGLRLRGTTFSEGVTLASRASIPAGGRFATSDPLLNRIWAVSATTAGDLVVPGPLETDALGRPCPIRLETVILDGLIRDRCPHVGAQAVTGKTLLVSTPSALPALRAMLVWFARAQRANGAIPDRPGSKRLRFDDNAYWIEGVFDYVRFTGDLAFARRLWPHVLELMNGWYPAQAGPAGLLVNHLGAADYALIHRHGRTIAYFNAGYARALEQAAQLARWLGQPAQAAAWRARQGPVRRAFDSTFWDPRAGAYVDSPTGPTIHPEDGNAFAILAGLATPPRARSALDYLSRTIARSYGNTIIDVDAWTYPGWGGLSNRRVYPPITYFEVLARYASGLDESALELIRREWGYMIANGDRRGMWKDIGPFGGAPVDDQSWNAGWSTGAAGALTSYVLGVQPGSLGFRTFAAEPHPSELLWARGDVPTPSGNLHFEWARSASGYSVHLDSPVPGTVTMPVVGEVLVDGRPASSDQLHTRAPGAHKSTVSVTAGSHTLAFRTFT